MAIDNNGAEDLATLNEDSLTAPKTRVKSIVGVRNRISEIKRGDRDRSLRRNKFLGLYDGNRPRSTEKMRKMGRGEDPNINWREAEGRVAAATVPYYDLSFEVPKPASIYFRYGDNPQKMQEWGEIVSDEYRDTLWDWDGYDVETQLRDWQMVVFGVGIPMFDSPRGWYFATKKAGTFLVADNANCNIARLGEGIAIGYFEPTELWRKIDKKNIDKGWNVKQAKYAIINAAPEDERKQWGENWDLYQTSLRRGDVTWSNKESRIYYTDYLVKEFDGKITHCIVLDNVPNDNDGTPDDFLFKKIGRFELFSEIICPFFYDVGPDAEWNSVKGLAPKIYDECDTSNVFNNTLLAGAMAGCGVALRATNSSATQKMQQTPIVRAGGMTLLPPDWEPVNVQLLGRLDQIMMVKREFQMTGQSNTGQYRQRVSLENQEPTLGQAELNAGQQATLSKGAYNRHYHNLDKLHREIVRRMLDPKITEDDAGGKEAKEMIERCIKRGVPKEVLKFSNVCKVRAVRNIGYGSAAMQQITSRFLTDAAPTMGEVGRNHALRTAAVPYVGQEHVDQFYPPIEDAGIPTNQEWSATTENNDLMMSGGTALVVPEQNPVIHFGTHFQKATQMLQGLQQGQADPKQVQIFLHQAGPHMKQHLDQMAGDETRKDQFMQMNKMWLTLAKMADKLDKEIAQADQQQQQAQPQVDPKQMESLILGLAKIKGEQEIKRMKVVGDLQLKAEKQSFTHGMKADDQQFKHELKDGSTAFDMTLEDLKARSQPAKA